MDEQKMQALFEMDETLREIGTLRDRKMIEWALNNDEPAVAIDVVRQWKEKLECLMSYFSVNTF